MKRLAYLTLAVVISVLAFQISTRIKPNEQRQTSELGMKSNLNLLRTDTAPSPNSHVTMSELLLSWSEIGPHPSFEKVYYSGNTSGYHRVSGRIQCVALDPSNKNVVYFGLMDGGIWKTTDRGKTWDPLYETEAVRGTWAIAVHPTAQNILFASWNAGVYKSTDAGNSWQQILTSASQSIIIDPLNPNNIYVKGFVSRDGGASWSSLETSNIIAIDPNAPSRLYYLENRFTGGLKLYKSVDSGNTWNQLATFNGSGGLLDIARSNSSVVYALIWSSTGSNVFKSIDAGQTWTDLQSWPGKSGGFLGGMWGYVGCIAINPFNADEVYVGGVRLYKTTDAGSTWNYSEQVHPPEQYIHVDFRSVVFDRDSVGLVYFGNDGGVYRSRDDWQTYQDLNESLGTILCYSLGVSNQSRNHYLIGTQDNGTFFVKDGVGYGLGTGDVADTYFHPSSENITFERSFFSGLYRFKLSKGDWSNFNYSDVQATPLAGAILKFNKRDPNRVFTKANSILRATDGAATTNSLQSISPAFNGRTYDIGGADSMETIYASTSTRGQVALSTDGGNNWQYKQVGTQIDILSMFVHPNSPNIVYIAAYDYTVPFNSGDQVFKSSDFGSTWQRITPTSSGFNSITKLFASPNDNWITVLAEQQGLHYKHRDSTNWTKVSGPPNVVSKIKDFYWAPNGALIAATFGRGIWETNLFPMSNTPPAILTYYPHQRTITVTQNAPLNFAVTAIDSEEQQLGFRWLIDEIEQTLTGARGVLFVTNTGQHSVKCVVTDGLATDSLVWVVNAIPTSVATESTPNIFSLANIYPNPFNSEAMIEYEVPIASHVLLDVHDINGRQVLILENSEKGAGRYRVKISGNALSSGVYFCSMKAGAFSQTRKFLLVK